MVDETILSGKRLQLNFDVENRGDRRGSQTVELLLDGTVVDENAVVLDSAEKSELSLVTDAFSDDDEGQVFGVEVVIGTRTETTLDVEVIDIPDHEVYLHDDWEDNRLTDREDSGTTTYNGVEGVYRPEWTALNGDSNLSLPSVSDEILTVQSDEGMFADLNLNLDETVTWEWSNVDPSSGASGDFNNNYLGLFADDIDAVDVYVKDSYAIRVQNGEAAELLHLSDKDSSDGWSTVVSGSTTITGAVDITVTRDSDGNWELFVNGSSEGTGQDTQSTDPSYLPIWCHVTQDAVVDVDELKIF